MRAGSEELRVSHAEFELLVGIEVEKSSDVSVAVWVWSSGRSQPVLQIQGHLCVACGRLMQSQAQASLQTKKCAKSVRQASGSATDVLREAASECN